MGTAYRADRSLGACACSVLRVGIPPTSPALAAGMLTGGTYASAPPSSLHQRIKPILQQKAPHRRSGEGQSSISVTVSALLFMGLLDSQKHRLSVQAPLAEHIDRSLSAVSPLRVPEHGHAVAAVGALNVYDHSSIAPYRPSCAVCVLRSVSIAPDFPSAYQPEPSLTQVLASIQPSWSK